MRGTRDFLAARMGRRIVTETYSKRDQLFVSAKPKRASEEEAVEEGSCFVRVCWSSGRLSVLKECFVAMLRLASKQDERLGGYVLN